MKIALLFGITGVVGAVVATQGSADSMLAKNTQQLQAAAVLKVDYTVQNLPDAPLQYKLELGKPGKFRFESPDEVIVANGTTVWDYKKSDNTYSQADQQDDDVKNLLKKDAAWAWAGFFNKEPFKGASEAKVGAKRVMKGKPITEVSLNLPGKPDRTGTLFIDQDLGVARGMSVTRGEKQTLIVAKDVTLSNDAAPDADFNFTIPDGAKKVDPNAASAYPFSRAAAVFNTNCIGCHNATRPRSGLDLSSYSATMNGGRNGQDVIAGDPDNSPIMAYLSAKGKPQMPPAGALSQSDIQTIADWIKNGAKEK
jgi:outer membrane lipoprotein-sorting protein